MTRDQGLNLVKLYDNHYPVEFIDQYLDYFQMKKSSIKLLIFGQIKKYSKRAKVFGYQSLLLNEKKSSNN